MWHNLMTVEFYFHREQVELTCDLLSHILGCFNENELLGKYQDLFLEGLSHPQMLVKELILRQVNIITASKQLHKI